MGKYSVPDEIRKYKPKGAMVKRINNSYYVYEYSCVKDTTTGKWKTKMGNFIGTIKEKIGFIPSNDSLSSDNITIYEYGQYYILFRTTESVLTLLKESFNPFDSMKIYLLSLFYYVNGFNGITGVDEYFKQSYLSKSYSDISMSYYSIHELLDSLGRKQERVIRFETALLNKSNKLAIDGHDFVSYSTFNDLTDFGNKYNQTKEAQMNMLTVYDLDSSTPILAKTYPGSVLDKTSIKDLLALFKIKDKLIIIDAGFYSKENIELISNDNQYIIPLSKNLKEYKSHIDTLDYKNSFIYESNHKKDPIYYKEELTNDKTKIIVYKNMTINALEAADYRKKIGTSGAYTEEIYEKTKDYFGMVILETNLSQSPEEIYCKYKERWNIETFFNFMKNRLNIDTLNEQDFYIIQGLTFITVILGLIHSTFKEKIKETKLSYQDVLLQARMIKLSSNGKEWEINNSTKKVRELFSKCGCELVTKIKI